MTHATLKTLNRRALPFAALFLAVAPASFAGEPIASDRDVPFIGQVTVTATRETPFLGHLVVTAIRPAPSYVAVTDLGAMTVTASRETAIARNESPLAWHVAP